MIKSEAGPLIIQNVQRDQLHPLTLKQQLRSKNEEQTALEGTWWRDPLFSRCQGKRAAFTWQAWGWSDGMFLPGRWPEPPGILGYWSVSVKTGLRETHQVRSYRIQSKLQGVTYLFRWHFLPPSVSILPFQSSSQEGNALIVYSRLQLSSPTAKPVLILQPWWCLRERRHL